MVRPHDKHKPTLADDDPTGEEEALDFDPTRTDVIEAPALAIDNPSGAVVRDERGQAQWVVIPSSRATDETFDQFQALDNEALAVDAKAPERPESPNRKSGCDPYDTGPAKPLKKHR